MGALLLAAGDAIQKDVEATLDAAANYRKLNPDEKLERYLTIAVNRMCALIGAEYARLAPLITDFVGFGASIYEHHHLMDVAKRAGILGLSGRELHTVDLGGASTPAALEIARRLCEHEERLVLIAGSEIPRGGPASIAYYREVSDTLLHPVTEKHSEANLIALYALLADRLMHESKVTQKDAAAITLHYRQAALNQERAATFGKALKPGELDRHLAGIYSTPMVAVATDHGIAFLVAHEKVYARLIADGVIRPELPALWVNAVGTNFGHKYLCERPDFSSPAKLAAERAFSALDLAPQAIDYAWIYDCFTLMLVRQAADYFGITPSDAAQSLAEGQLILGNKRIAVNRDGGILNTQAAIALSAASGLIDILRYAKDYPEAEHFLFGGNGGIDCTNAVAILSRKPLARKSQVLAAQNHPPPKAPKPLSEGETLTLYAAVAVRFNPGSAVPFGLGAFRRADDSLCLLRLIDQSGEPVLEVDRFERDRTSFTVNVREGIPYAQSAD